VADRGPRPLGIITSLLAALDTRSIQYCHWKSNEHLRASLLGQTDLDVLAAREAAPALGAMLSELGFKRCRSSQARTHPGIESHLALDAESGRLVHLHLHYQLTLGEQYLKGYRIPWEHELLASRRLAPEGVYVADPHLELLLLVIRTALKVRSRDRIRAIFKHRPLPAAVRREFAWLAERIDRSRLQTLARGLVGDRAAARLDAMVAQGAPDLDQALRFRREVEPSLHEYRSFPPFTGRARRWVLEAIRRLSGRRQLPQGGVLVAVLGADGAGKSTMTRELAAWLAPQLDLTTIYFGSGQGPASAMRRALERAARVMKWARPSAKATGKVSRGESRSRLRIVGELLWVASLARERARRTAEARRARNRGHVVLCDRYPQGQFVGNEGPWLRHWVDHPSLIRRAVARRELGVIRAAERLRPDLVIRLNVTEPVALQRKPDTPVELLRRKLAILPSLTFAPGTEVADVDATRPFEEVLLEVKRRLWCIL
jgi:thymidylate kinase